MIRADGFDKTIFEVAPQNILRGFGAQRRRAFGGRAKFFNVVLRQCEIMRTGFARHVHTLRLRAGDERHACAAADMDNVQRAFRLARHLDGAMNRFEFRVDWT